MSDIIYVEQSYCSLCDRYFVDDENRTQHILFSSTHPLCNVCNRRFLNGNGLRNHYINSSHAYCTLCDQYFMDDDVLMEHVQESPNHPSCNACHHRFINGSTLTSHVTTSHVYCPPCDQHFLDDGARARHIQASPQHPRCDPCDRRFLNNNALRNHLVYSSRHHYCVMCEKSFATAAGLRAHIEFSPVHCDDSDEDDSDIEEPPDGWEDEYGQYAFPDEGRNASEGSDLDDLGEDAEEYDIDTLDDDDNELPESDRDAGIVLNSSADPSESPDTDSSPQYKCPLCLDTSRSFSATVCGHIFCTPCIHRTFRPTSGAGGKCPMCRTSGIRKQLRKVYPNVM